MKNRIKKQITTPLTREQAEKAVLELAREQNGLARLVTQKNRDIIAVEEKFTDASKAARAIIEDLTEQIQTWADTNPQEFDKRRSVDFPAGTVGFRTGMPKLALLSRAWNWEKALDAVLDFLPHFVRNKPEIDKEAIIGQANELEEFLPKCGLKVIQGETFFIEPKLETVAPGFKGAA